MEDDDAMLSAGFAINTENAFGELQRFYQFFDAGTIRVLEDMRRVEIATGGMMKLSPATREVAAFSAGARQELASVGTAAQAVATGMTGLAAAMSTTGAAATREARSAAAERNRVNAEVEKSIRLAERETLALTQTKEEARAAKVERLALAAAGVGNNPEGAARLQYAERQRQIALDNRAEEQAEAARRATAAAAEARARAEGLVNVQLMERARLEGLLERNFGVDRISATQAGATFSALAERERELELAERATVAAREESVAIARQNSLLAERAQIEAALQRNFGVDRPRATDLGATYSALAARAAEDEARAQKMSAAAAKQAAEEHGRLASMLRASHSAQVADAEAAERLRMSTDPLYAATKRLNAEIAESTRLYHAGVTAPGEYARQQEVLATRLRMAGQAHDVMATSARRGSGTLTQLSFQLNDVATMAAMGAKPMQIFASQAGQIFQVAQMAEGGVKGFATQIGGLAMRFAPLAIIAAGAGVALYQWHKEVEKDAGMKAYVHTLGLTHKELKKLGDQSVTTGDMLKGFWRAVNEPGEGGGKTLMSRLVTDADKKVLTDLLDFSLQVFKGIGAATYGLLVGSYRAGVAIWNQFPAALGDIFIQAVNGSTKAIEFLVNKGVDAVNAIARAGNKIIGHEVFGQFENVRFEGMANPFKGAAKSLGKDIYQAFDGAAKEGLNGIDRIIDRTGKFAVQSARERARKKADEIIADRTPKTDKHAEQLAREAEAVEAQIRNTYRLADAYDVSGAAALIAEARVKAESAAIRKRGDIEQFVDRQVRLSIAERVKTAAQSSAAMRDQAAIQAEVNTAVSNGLVPAGLADELVQKRLRELPLLQAVEAAQMRGLTAEAKRATKALEDQRNAQRAADAAAIGKRFVAADKDADNRLADLRTEASLIGATNIERVRVLATIRATRELEDAGYKQGTPFFKTLLGKQVEIAVGTERNAQATRDWNDALRGTADLWDTIANTTANAARGMADAFGEVGKGIGDAANIMTGYYADQARLEADHISRTRDMAAGSAALAREQQMFAIRSASLQIGAYGEMTSAAKGFFKEGSTGYRAMATAEKVFRAVELGMAVKNAAVQLGLIGGVATARTVATGGAIATDTAFTATTVANAGVRASADATAAMAKTAASSPFPFNLAGMAVMAAALASIGIATGFLGGGGKNTLQKANDGSGTVLGDTSAKSESLKRSIDALRDIDTLMLSSSREMAGYLRSIDGQIGGVAALIVRAGDVNASAGVSEGFKTNAVGSVLKAVVPVFGGALASLFGTKTTVVGSGLYGGAQSLGSVLSGGFDASYYSDVEKKKKFLGITTGTKYSTQLTGADAGLENQFTLILRGFNDAIKSAAGPLGASTDEIQRRLNGFVVDIGKIDLKGLTGEQIQEKLSAVFGAAADKMALAAFPGFEKFQKVGEGAFETLVRVASTVESVSASLDLLGGSARTLGIDAKVGIAGQFDSVSALTNAADAYFQAFYSREEQAAAKTAQFARVFDGLGMAMPATLAGFRALVEAQDLTTAAGQSTYATLLQLAPAFADLQSSMSGAKSAADILAERQDLERKILELNGDTAAIRALDLAKVDVSNRALQEQVWAIEDAQKAAQAAEQLANAWSSVGNSIDEEIRRIRGLSDGAGGTTFAAAFSAFNAATISARAGDQDAAKLLPSLSQVLLKTAGDAATSRQELDRVQAQTAASLEQTSAVIAAIAKGNPLTNAGTVAASAAAAQAAAPATNNTAANDTASADLRDEIMKLRSDLSASLSAVASNTGRMASKLDDVTSASGGDAVSVTGARA